MPGTCLRPRARLTLVSLSAVLLAAGAIAQDRYDQLPGYDRMRATQRALGNSLVSGGRINDVVWAADGSRITFRREGAWFAYAFETGQLSQIEEDEREQAEESDRGGRRGGVARGRQRDAEPSPDGAWIAKHEDWNLRLYSADESQVIPVTTDGRREFKYATGSWVYGEELRQNSAMWWSPDSRRIAFYEFDERKVKPYYLTPGLTQVQNELYIEGYPKAGADNPIVGLLIYDLESRKSVRVEVGDDEEQYVYNIRWRPDGSELLFNHTNRHQNVLTVMAADPETGKSRVVLTETQDTYQQNSPMMRFLEDGERFIWETERTKWTHYELRHIDGSLLTPLTSGEHACDGIVQVDENAGWMYYRAFSSETPLNLQLHRARLDGSEDVRLSTNDLSHTFVSISPDHRHFIATMESIESPPSTSLFDMNGTEVATLAQADTSGMNGRPWPEMITFKAEDGETDLYGVLYKPSDFDPSKSYPLLVEVYGGPWSQTVRSRFIPAHAQCELGFIIFKMDNRGTPNRGKNFEDAAYLKLGIVDIQDQADGVKHLAQREYIDGSRVGITGHSYGGYMSALAVLKFPDIFHVAVAGAAVTDWKNYDTIYTERFMRTPKENPDGYRDGSCLTYAEQLTGRLLLLHGMEDDNVHPANVWQLAHELQQRRKKFDMMFFPTSAHGFRTPSAEPLKWEYLYEHLVEGH